MITSGIPNTEPSHVLIIVWRPNLILIYLHRPSRLREALTRLPQRLVSGLEIDRRSLFTRELGRGLAGAARLYQDTSTEQQVAMKIFHSRYPKGSAN